MAQERGGDGDPVDGRIGVAWLLVLNAHGIPILSRSHGMDSPPLVMQGLVNGLFSAGTEGNARLTCVSSRVRTHAV